MFNLTCKTLALCVFGLFEISTVYTQNLNTQIDSLEIIVKDVSLADSTKARLLLDLGALTYRTSPDDAISYCKQAEDFVNNANLSAMESDVFAWLAYLFNKKGDVEEALKYYGKSYDIALKYGDKRAISKCFNNIGTIYENQGDVIKALEYFYKALKIREELQDSAAIATSLNNIGAFYDAQGNPKKAIEYYQRSLDLKILIGNQAGIATTLGNIGYVHESNKEFHKALVYFLQALKIQEPLNEYAGISTTLNNIGDAYLKLGEIKKADHFASRSLRIAEELGYPRNIRMAANLLSHIYVKQNNAADAVKMINYATEMRDSVNNLRSQRAVANQQAKFEYDRKKALDDASHEIIIAKKKEEKTRQEIISYAIGFGLLLVVVFLGFVYNRLKVARRQRNEISEQKRTIELTHLQLEEQHNSISDSIAYAKWLQEAILPAKEDLKRELKDGFILFKPKDVVSGDFYWLGIKDEVGLNDAKVYFAAADCTGHGVPGAMVSVVCSNALDQALIEFNLTETGKILDKVTELVIKRFDKGGADVKDGMDIALCMLDGNKLMYSGANNPLWIVRTRNAETVISHRMVYNDDYYIEEFSANRQPVGKYRNQVPFHTYEMELNKGDSLYVFSDGLPDQFGGPKGKKFKSKSFKKLLLSIQDSSMNKQQELIHAAFEDWRGNVEQVDDVCVIGVRV